MTQKRRRDADNSRKRGSGGEAARGFAGRMRIVGASAHARARAVREMKVGAGVLKRREMRAVWVLARLALYYCAAAAVSSGSTRNSE
jgi:hypothetical protein